MSEKNVKERMDSLLDVDIEKIIKEADREVSAADQVQMQKYKQRNEVAEKMRSELILARNMPCKKWGEAILKNSVEKMMISQDILCQEIIDNPASKNTTSLSELSNSITTAVVAVMDIEREDQKHALAKEKNELRRMEIDIANGGKPTIDASGKTIVGVGTNDDILRLMKHGIEPAKLTQGIKDATSNPS